MLIAREAPSKAPMASRAANLPLCFFIVVLKFRI
jgi:hypothetical protein